MNKKSYFGDLMLFLAAFIWGTAFVAQVTGMDKIGPFTFNMARSIVAVICLGGYLIFTKAKIPENKSFLLKKILKIKDCLLNICSLFMNFKILKLLNCI